jgi:hypothetical protein
MLTASGPLPPLDHIDRDPLAFCQLADPGALQSRCMHENVLAAAVADDEVVHTKRRKPPR